MTNLEKHRKALVSAACEAMGAILNPGKAGTMYRAEFEGETLTPKTLHPSNVVAVAGECDGIEITAWRRGAGSRRLWVRIVWGNGVGSAVSDYSASMDGDANWQTVLDWCEFMEI